MQIGILKERLKNTSLPDQVRESAETELSRASGAPTSSIEYNTICSYIDWILALPWGRYSKSDIDLSEAALILNEHIIGLRKAKNRILEIMSTSMTDPDTGIVPPISLTGSTGTGKRSFASTVAKAFGRNYIELSRDCFRTESDIRGEWRRDIGNRPGALIRALSECGTADPVILVDGSWLFQDNGSPEMLSILTELLCRGKTRAFYDRYINLDFDLSRAMLFITARADHQLPPEISDVCENISFPGYTNKTKMEIARRSLIPKKLQGTGLAIGSRSFTDDILTAIITGYTFESGVHQLEGVTETLCRKLAREKYEMGVRRFSLSVADIAELLGPPTIRPEIVGRYPEVGNVTAPIAGISGGSVIFVEANRMSGHGNVKVTGAEHSVINELVEQSISFVLSHIDDLELSREMIDSSDIHIHYPPGVASVDARSLGLATIVVLVSLFSEMPVHQNFAFCGEITLRGKILPVDYIEEKVFAAHRAGVTRIYLSSHNKREISFVPEEIRNDIEFVFADTVSDALSDSLMKIIVPNRNLDPEIDALTGD